MEMDWQAGASSARGRGRGSREGDAKERACARGVGVGGGGGGSRAVGLDDASLSLSPWLPCLKKEVDWDGWMGGWGWRGTGGPVALARVVTYLCRHDRSGWWWWWWWCAYVRAVRRRRGLFCFGMLDETRSAVGNKKWLRVAGRVHRAVLGTACEKLPRGCRPGFGFAPYREAPCCGS